MEEKLAVKENAVELLVKQLELRAKKKQYGIIVLSSATDPYLHIENELGLTRKLLEVILHYKFPLHVITKSDLVIRDFDLLKQIDKAAILPGDLQHKLLHRCFITFSFSTINDGTGKIFEPGAPSPSIRLETLKTALKEQFHSGISLMPLLPYISDTAEQLEKAFSTFAAIGAKYIFPAGLTLFGDNPSDSKQLILRAIEKHYPNLLEKYQKLFAGNNTQLPFYYQQAFIVKAKELSEKYSMKNSII